MSPYGLLHEDQNQYRLMSVITSANITKKSKKYNKIKIDKKWNKKKKKWLWQNYTKNPELIWHTVPNSNYIHNRLLTLDEHR